MSVPVSDIAFTPAVKQAQSERGSRAVYEKVEQRGGWRDRIDGSLIDFLAARDSFYFGTASADGRPYIQHRGGPRGFLRVLDDRTLAFADFAGNRQYISIGNLSENDQAFLFLMDYPNQSRVKIWGRARIVEDDPELLDRLADPSYPGKPERAVVFCVEAWDVNCRQHIRERYTVEEIDAMAAPLRERIADLERENAELRQRLEQEPPAP